mmetsp:Transcript_25027/g.38728  ORF Transcript_25027/g.38728 Transcript_25027/m.38728 type:complete len:247 (+) Transcript_25027:2-742(+)
MILERGHKKIMNDTLFIDCMVDNFYGYSSFNKDFQIFEPNRIRLGPYLAAFNASFSSAIIAYMEATFLSDDDKNNMCFFLKGNYCDSVPEALLGAFFLQVKTMTALCTNHPPAIRFLLNSRTSPESPIHRGGSLLQLLWAACGPLQMAKMGLQIVRKVDGGEFSDIEHRFGAERPDRPARRVLLHKKTKSSTGHAYPPPEKVPFAWGRCFSLRCLTSWTPRRWMLKGKASLAPNAPLEPVLVAPLC